MPSINEYFEKDTFNCDVTSQSRPTLQNSFNSCEITARQLWNFSANAKFITYYIPANNDLFEVCKYIILNLNLALDNHNGVTAHTSGRELELKSGWVGSSSLIFSRRVFLYSESELGDSELYALAEQARIQGLSLVYRGPQYAVERTLSEKPIAFISHDSRDKDNIARPLATELQNLRCTVWYDEFSLKVGDSLRESIERGIKDCDKCILILSQSFLSNIGWTKAEFNSIFTREIIEKNKVMLPIWVDVSPENVYEYSPNLADRVASKWENGIEQVTKELLRSLVS